MEKTEADTILLSLSEASANVGNHSNVLGLASVFSEAAVWLFDLTGRPRSRGFRDGG